MARPTVEDRLDVIEACNTFGWLADRQDWQRFAELLAPSSGLP